MTAQEAVAWLNGNWRQSPYTKYIQGVGTGIDVDGWYGFQCFDFSNALSIQAGAGRLSGATAAELWETAPASLQRVQDPLPGDIFVLAADYNNGPGHTGGVTEVRAGRKRWVGQSQNFKPASSTVGSPPVPAEYTDYKLRGFLRPNYQGGIDMGAAQDNETRHQQLDAIARAVSVPNADHGIQPILDNIAVLQKSHAALPTVTQIADARLAEQNALRSALGLSADAPWSAVVVAAQQSGGKLDDHVVLAYLENRLK